MFNKIISNKEVKEEKKHSKLKIKKKILKLNK
jgi:hypothetical protein